MPDFRCQINLAIKWLEAQLRNPREYNDTVNLLFLDREEPPQEEQITSFCAYLKHALYQEAEKRISTNEELKLSLINTPFPLETLADALKVANISAATHRFPLQMRIEITPHETVVNLRTTAFCVV
jgi:hypothetical protein